MSGLTAAARATLRLRSEAFHDLSNPDIKGHGDEFQRVESSCSAPGFESIEMRAVQL
jgi:hypothetical protein